MCKLNEQEGEKEVNNRAEDEQIAVIAVGVNLQKTRMEKFLLVKFGHMAPPPHEISASVFSKRRNRVGKQMKMTRERKKQ